MQAFGFGELQQLPRLRQVRGERFFGVDVLTRLQGRLRHGVMRRRGSEVRDNVDFRIREQRLVVRVAAEAVMPADHAEPRLIDVRDPGDFELGMLIPTDHVQVERPAAADDADLHFFAAGSRAATIFL